jgi:hypothetical protein
MMVPPKYNFGRKIGNNPMFYNENLNPRGFSARSNTTILKLRLFLYYNYLHYWKFIVGFSAIHKLFIKIQIKKSYN